MAEIVLKKLSELDVKPEPVDGDSVLILDSETETPSAKMAPFAALKGEKGDQGEPGEQGPPGEKGDQGEQGPAGEVPADVVTAAGTLGSGNLVSGAGGKAAQDASIAAANVVTATANLTNNQLVRGNGAKGLSVLSAGSASQILRMVSGSPAWSNEREAGVYNYIGSNPPGGPASGEAFLDVGVGDTWDDLAEIVVAGFDRNGWRSEAASLVGLYEGGMVLVDGGTGAWALYRIAQITVDEGFIVGIDEIIAQGSLFTNLGNVVRISFFPPEPGIGAGDVIGPDGGTVANQVAVFSDTTGKLITNRALLTASTTAVTIGNASAATVQIGHASGGGTTFNGNATFNGALLSPGIGTNSFKAGSGASAGGTGAIAIGLNSVADIAGGLAIGSGARAGATNVNNIAIGENSTCGTGASTATRSIALGTSATCSGGSRSIAIGEGTTSSAFNTTTIGVGCVSSHAGAVTIGRDSSNNAAASSNNNDFTLGTSSHNYRLPGTIVTDLRFRTTTGTKIGTGTDQLIGFWNATPVDQPAAIADATDGTDVIARCNDILAMLRETGLIASA